MTVIAIDGPSGSGKSTIAAALSHRLGLERLDTGAMYRAVGLVALRAGADPQDEPTLRTLACEMELAVTDHVHLAGEDITEAIRSAEVTRMASLVATMPLVRAELVRRQRQWIADHGGGIVEGRDIGSVVVPNADLKIYLTADLDERGRRRAAELANATSSVGAVANSLADRDARDASRAASPLVVADGAVVIDSTTRSVDDIVDEVLSLL